MKQRAEFLKEASNVYRTPHFTAYENEEQLFQSFTSECKTGAVLYHKTFGEMRILSKCEDIITVRLRDGSQKKFNLQVLFEKRLLKTGV